MGVLVNWACERAVRPSCRFLLFARGGQRRAVGILVPFFLFPWRRVLARAVDPRRVVSSNLYRRLASRAHFLAIVDDDQERAGTEARAHFAATRPERAARPGRRNREGPISFPLGLCVTACGEAPSPIRRIV